MVDRRMQPEPEHTDGAVMSEKTIDPTEDERSEFTDRSTLQAELQQIARSKAPEHAESSRGFWAKLRGNT